jgi:hypothetical protein
MLNSYARNKCYLCFIYLLILWSVVRNYKIKVKLSYKFQNYLNKKQYPWKIKPEFKELKKDKPNM